MAAPGGKFFIQDKLKDVAPHHESFQVSPVTTLLVETIIWTGIVL